MRITLIGMSGSGKSYWSRKLAAHGFQRFCCDDLIAARLTHELTQPDGTVMRLGTWMGFPYQPHYQEREARYLACEVQVMQEISAHLERVEGSSGPDIVIDTTGSVIYTGEEILQRLSRTTTVAHLTTPTEVQEQMLRAYMARPRPVLWRGLFNKEAEETYDNALSRCYPGLLAAREQLYERYAHVKIDYYARRQEGFTIQEFLKAIDPGTT